MFDCLPASISPSYFDPQPAYRIRSELVRNIKFLFILRRVSSVSCLNKGDISVIDICVSFY